MRGLGPARAVRRLRGALVMLAGVAVLGPAEANAGGSAGKKIETVCRTLSGDANYKVRVQAALVLGKMGDPSGATCLTRALDDANRTVRAVAAEALGRLGNPEGLPAVRALAKSDPDPFVRAQAEKAVAMLSAAGPSAGPSAGGSKAKIFLAFGPFSGGVKVAAGEPVRIVHDTLQNELAKIPSVTVAANAAPTGKPGGPSGFWIDGNISKLDDVTSGAGSETSCGVKVMVARWPSKSIISWTSAEASVQAGSRPRDRENARRECLEATAAQLAEDLAKFLKAQGG